MVIDAFNTVTTYFKSTRCNFAAEANIVKLASGTAISTKRYVITVI